MRRSSIILLSGLLAVALLVPTAALARTVKVDICHLNELGGWQLISVSANGMAVDAHLAHGDALPGQAVPGMSGYTFDENCVPDADAVVSVSIEKSTNGSDADEANDGDVPTISSGDFVVWSYSVTNLGAVSIPGADVVVTDDQIGVVSGPSSGDDGNGSFDPGETWVYEAASTAADLSATAFTTVPGCGDGRPTYENVGTVTVPGDTDSDTSHYCNPAETIFAVAYTDESDDGGQYDPAHDVLIAKLVDFNNSGIPDAGDKVIMGQYPTNLAGTAFANWGITDHTLESVTVSLDGCTGSIANSSFEATFQFHDSSGEEWYYEIGTSIYSYIADDVPSGADVLYVFIGSPSQPEGPDLQLSDMTTWQGDDTYVDIDLSPACISS